MLGELSAQNAGLSRWGACERGRKRFFIKEFLSPIYPEDPSALTPRMLKRRMGLCERFCARHTRLYNTLIRCQTGNIVFVRDFFRDGSKYYVVTDWVDGAALDPSQTARLDFERKVTLSREIAYNVATLHSAGIVHADLKPDNLLIKKTQRGFVTAKIVDFDAGFLTGDEPESLQGDFVYLAPETYLKMEGHAVDVDEKVDVFALGLLLHQVWAGRLPSLERQCQYAFEAALNDTGMTLAPELPSALSAVITPMLMREPAQRPRAAEVFDQLGGLGQGGGRA